MKKLLAVILSFILFLCCAGCNERGDDSEEVKKSGKLVVGVTEFAPMNYIEDGEWTGFDTEFARLFAKEKLGVDVEFVEIIWDDRFDVLDSYKIDCIWNGMTFSEKITEKASISDAYLRNEQIIVANASIAENCKDGYDIEGFNFAVEKGSAAEECLERMLYNDKIVTKETQIDAIKAVIAGETEAAIVDITLADAMVGEGKKYSQLATAFSVSNEVYAVAFRKGSDLTEMLNDFMDEIRDDELLKLANKYGLTLA